MQEVILFGSSLVPGSAWLVMVLELAVQVLLAFLVLPALVLHAPLQLFSLSRSINCKIADFPCSGLSGVNT